MSFELSKGTVERLKNQQKYGHEAGLIGKTLEDMEKRQIAREEAARNEQRMQAARERRAKIAELTRKMIDLNAEQAATILGLRTRAVLGPAAAACSAAMGALARVKCPACRFEIPADASMCGQCRSPVPADPSREAARVSFAQDVLRDISGKIVDGMVTRDALVTEGYDDCMRVPDSFGGDDAVEYLRVAFEARAASPNDRLDAFEDNIAAGRPPWAADDVAVRVRAVFAELEGPLAPLVALAAGAPAPDPVGWVFEAHDVVTRATAAVEASRRASWAKACEAGMAVVSAPEHSRIPLLWIRTAAPAGTNVVEAVIDKDIRAEAEVNAHTDLAKADVSKFYGDFLGRRGGAKDGTVYVDRSREFQALRFKYVTQGLINPGSKAWIDPYVSERMALEAKTSGFVARPPALTAEAGLRAACWVYTTGTTRDPSTLSGPSVPCVSVPVPPPPAAPDFGEPAFAPLWERVESAFEEIKRIRAADELPTGATLLGTLGVLVAVGGMCADEVGVAILGGALLLPALLIGVIQSSRRTKALYTELALTPQDPPRINEAAAALAAAWEARTVRYATEVAAWRASVARALAEGPWSASG